MLENRGYWCIECRHINRDGIIRKTFPGKNGYGVPSDILAGLIKHDKPLSWQGNDIVFQRRKIKKLF
jgi:hypothetical protein